MTDARVYLTGVLHTPSPEDVAIVNTHLPRHIELTNAEPGCISFDVHQDPDNPRLWRVAECFRDEAAFAAHQHRVAQSDWGKATAHLARDYSIEQR